jgi:tRNA (cytidine/uridine-2'-O-)-methyltransferase
MRDLPTHQLKIALLQPQIAPNTGNIARLCVATGTALHLVRPLGFILSDKNLRRSAMDYWPRLNLTVHDDTASFLSSPAAASPWFFTTSADRDFWSVEFAPDDTLVFGSETAGLSRSLLAAHPARTVRIPQAPDERCLNLSSAAAIALFEALRQVTSDSRGQAFPSTPARGSTPPPASQD